MPVNEDTNDFEGFNLLKQDALAAPTKVVKEKKEAVPADDKSDDADAKAIAALELAKKEADEAIANKSKAKTPDPKADESAEDEDQGSENETGEDEQSSFKAFAGFLKEEGVFDYEDEEFEDSLDGLKKLVNNATEKKLDNWKSSYDEDTQKYLEFVEAGGRPADFHKYYYNESSFLDFTVDTEENQKHAIREGLRLSGWEDEAEIEDEVALYEDAGKLESKANTYLVRLQKAEKENKQTLVEVQKKYAKEQEDIKKNEWKAFKDGLFEKEEISGFKFNKKMKDDLWDYMTKPVDKKTGITQYQKDSQDKGAEARYMFAYLLKNNWNVDSLTKDVKNKVVSNVRKSLSSFSDSRTKIKSGTNVQKDGDSDSASFAGFKSFLK